MDLNKLKKTFSLKGLLIVFFCLSLLLVVTIPWFMKAKIEANEGRAIGVLRSISTAQYQFQIGPWLDQDLDGFGEYGLLGELAGVKSRRGGKSSPNGQPPMRLGALPFLAPQTSFLERDGYNFQMYLPGSVPVTDDGTNKVLPLQEQTFIDIQERYFRTYAWPQSFNSSGIKCFALNQKSYIIAASNTAAIYSGAKKVPGFDAAVDAKEKDSSKMEGKFAYGTIAKDGQKWMKVND